MSHNQPTDRTLDQRPVWVVWRGAVEWSGVEWSDMACQELLGWLLGCLVRWLVGWLVWFVGWFGSLIASLLVWLTDCVQSSE